MSQKASGYERVVGDRYFTPSWVVDALLSVESFNGFTVDPAAGAGHMVEALRAADVGAIGMDIAPEGSVTIQGDFLQWDADANIITNPPYGKGGRLAVEFIKHALKITEPKRSKVAMLLRVDFDSANGRRPIFGDHPAFSAKYVLTRRIRWANLEQSAAGPTENHAWFVWSWRHPKGVLPTLRYLPLPIVEGDHA